jgi:Kae1-associated kinase Bud32
VKNNKIIFRGAEAEISISSFLGNSVIKKNRIKKKYRIKNIDDKLISTRTKEEAKLMMESRKIGVCVPIIYDVDLENGIIIMEFIHGERIKDILNNILVKKKEKIYVLKLEKI